LATLPVPVLRKAITHASSSRIDGHFGVIAETKDINNNSLLYDFDRWGRLSLIARSWGNAPRENRTFLGRLKRAIAKDLSKGVTPDTVSVSDADKWHILAVSDYGYAAPWVLRSNLRRLESSNSYSGLLGKDQTTHRLACTRSALGRCHPSR
jgi:hypothetical protein